MGVPPDLQAHRLREQQERAQRIGASDEEELGGGGASRIGGGPTFGVPADEAPPAADAVRSHDVVWSLDNPGDLGHVWRVAGETDSESEESAYEDEEDHVPAGCASVSWLRSGEVATPEVTKLRVTDRSLVTGDLVADASSPLGQTGQVTHVYLKLDVELTDGQLISGVPSDRMALAHPFVPGHYVVGGCWVGRVDRIVHDITIAFDDGSIAKFVGEDHDESAMLVPISQDDMAFAYESSFIFYIGQRVAAPAESMMSDDFTLVAGPSVERAIQAKTVTPEVKSLASMPPDSRLATVIDVVPTRISVIWTSSADFDSGASAHEPPRSVAPELLRPMASFLATSWHLGDRGLLLPADSPSYTALAEVWPDMPGTTPAPASPDSRNPPAARNPSSQQHDAAAEPSERVVSADSGQAQTTDRSPRKRKGGTAAAVRRRRRRWRSSDDVVLAKPYGGSPARVVATYTMVDIQWQDGSMGSKVPATSLVPVPHRNDLTYDFAVNQFVEHLDPFADMDGAETQQEPRMGWIRSINSAARTANVVWRDDGTSSDLSVYQLREYPGFDFAIGDVVLKLPPPVEVAQGAAPVEVAQGPVKGADPEEDAKSKDVGHVHTGGDTGPAGTSRDAPDPAAAAAEVAHSQSEGDSTRAVVHPRSAAPPAASDAAAQATGADRAATATPAPGTRDPRRDWREVRDSVGRIYFHNIRTRVSQWATPDELLSPRECAVAATGWVQYYAHSGNLQGNQPEITQSYWHHGPTGATQWETPADVIKARADATAQQEEEPIDITLELNPEVLARIGEVIVEGGGRIKVRWCGGAESWEEPESLFVAVTEDDGYHDHGSLSGYESGEWADDAQGMEGAVQVPSVPTAGNQSGDDGQFDNADSDGEWETDNASSDTSISGGEPDQPIGMTAHPGVYQPPRPPGVPPQWPVIFPDRRPEPSSERAARSEDAGNQARLPPEAPPRGPVPESQDPRVAMAAQLAMQLPAILAQASGAAVGDAPGLVNRRRQHLVEGAEEMLSRAGAPPGFLQAILSQLQEIPGDSDKPPLPPEPLPDIPPPPGGFPPGFQRTNWGQAGFPVPPPTQQPPPAGSNGNPSAGAEGLVSLLRHLIPGMGGGSASEDGATNSRSAGNATATAEGSWYWPGRPANVTSGPAPTRSAAPSSARPEAADGLNIAARDARPASAATPAGGAPAQDGTAVSAREGATASGTVSSRGIWLEEVVPKKSAPSVDRTSAAHTTGDAPAGDEPRASSLAEPKGNPQPAEASCDQSDSPQRQQSPGASRQNGTNDPYKTEAVVADVAAATAAAFAAMHPYLPYAALQATYVWLYAAVADQACWSDVRKFGQDSRLVEGAKMAHAQLYHFHTMAEDAGLPLTAVIKAVMPAVLSHAEPVSLTEAALKAVRTELHRSGLAPAPGRDSFDAASAAEHATDAAAAMDPASVGKGGYVCATIAGAVEVALELECGHAGPGPDLPKLLRHARTTSVSAMAALLQSALQSRPDMQCVRQMVDLLEKTGRALHHPAHKSAVNLAVSSDLRPATKSAQSQQGAEPGMTAPVRLPDAAAVAPEATSAPAASEETRKGVATPAPASAADEAGSGVGAAAVDDSADAAKGVNSGAGVVVAGDSPALDGASMPYRCPQFEVLEELPAGHHFASSVVPAENPRAFAKCVRKEWAALKSLPSSIWVHAYENRLDLLRAVMVGPADTPYHDGLFFFDIKLPPNYPASPPQVYYHSHGLRVNPNLYDTGYVCLSLLNTWDGRPEESWRPATSTLLQVLVSIQGLVLVPEPYYNEAGYGRQVGSAGGARNSMMYNENAFLLSARNMIYTLRAPPADFAPLVQEHFLRRRPAILAAMDVYSEGSTPIGHASPSDNAAPSSAAAAAAAAAVASATSAAAAAASGIVDVASHPTGPARTTGATLAGGGAGASASNSKVPLSEGARGDSGKPSAAQGDAGAVSAPQGGPAETRQDTGGAGEGASGVGEAGGGSSGGGEVGSVLSEGFRMVLTQLRPRLEAALQNLATP